MNNKLKLVSSTEKERDRAIRWLNSKSPNSATFCADALAAGLKLNPSAIFLLSDGEFTDRRNVFRVLDDENQDKAAKFSRAPLVPIHTIALGSHIGQFSMKRIAEENDGEYRVIE